VNGTKNYTALEKFETTPIDLFRRVEMTKLHPTVASVNPSPLSSRAAAVCAAFKHSEYPDNAFSASGSDGSVVSHGVSLNCGSETSTFDPAISTLREDEPKGEFGVDLPAHFTPHKSSFGYLVPAEIYEQESLPYAICPVDGMFPIKDTQKRKGADKKNIDKSKTFSRTCYFRFKLPKGTDLQPLGVYVVLDRENHFSLICNQNNGPTNRWRLCAYGGIEPDPNAPPAGPEPESLGPMSFGEVRCPVALPKVAALFQLHDFLVKAAAVSRDVIFSPQADKNLQAVMLLLYNNIQGISDVCDFDDAAKNLVLASYDPDNTPCRDVRTLRAAVQEVHDFLEEGPGLEDPDAEEYSTDEELNNDLELLSLVSKVFSKNLEKRNKLLLAKS